MIYYLSPTNPQIDDRSVRIVASNDRFVIVYIPGRSVYRDGGTEYKQAEYVLLERTDSPNMVEEILRFPRSV